MTTLSRHMLPLAAIALIGLAGSSVAAFAQAQPPAAPAATNGQVVPPPFRCAPGEWSWTGKGGPKPLPSAAFQAVPGLNFNSANIYNSAASNYHFGETLTFNPPGPITSAKLTTVLKPNSADATNDAIDFFYAPLPTHFGFVINNLPGASPWQPPHAAQQFSFTFVRSATTVVPTTPAGYNSGAFFAGLDTARELSIYVEDDTSVQSIQLDLCATPAPKYDLVASKKHEGNAYTLDVTNAGSQIMPTGSIQVVEVVPAGLTIDSASFPGWTCSGVAFPVVGPDAFTCNYTIPAGGIATGAHLPQIVIKTEGKPECPNCMRARLFLKDVNGGQKPVDESDMKNNVSCAK